MYFAFLATLQLIDKHLRPTTAIKIVYQRDYYVYQESENERNTCTTYKEMTNFYVTQAINSK